MNQHFPLLPDGVIPQSYTAPTIDEDEITELAKGYEAFSVSLAQVAGHDFFGLRRMRIFQKDRVELECGYLQPDTPPDGNLVVKAPCRDSVGRALDMTLVLPAIHDWRVTVHCGEYKTGWYFTYTGKVTPDVNGWIELRPYDKSDATPLRLPLEL